MSAENKPDQAENKSGTSPEELPQVERKPQELLGDERHMRADARLLRKAVKEGWPISDELRQKVVDKLESLLDSEQERNRIAATKVLVSADTVNVYRERIEKDQGTQTQTVNVQVNVANVLQSAGVDRLVGLDAATRERILASGAAVAARELEGLSEDELTRLHEAALRAEPRTTQNIRD